MSITKEEKEALFAEFEARMSSTKNNGCHSGYETKNNLRPAWEHFYGRYQNLTKSFPYEIWTKSIIHLEADWTFVRKLVCHAYGASIVKQLRPEQLEDANKLAMQITDLIFDRNLKTLTDSIARELG